MRLRGDSEIHDTAAPLGCQVRRLRLRRGECRGFRGVRVWVDGSQMVNLLLAYPTGLALEEPWSLISNAEPSLDLVWSYAQRFCCEQLFRDQKSGIFQLASSGLRDPERIDRLLLVIAIAVLVGSLQGYELSLNGLRRQVDPHWKRGMSFLRIGLAVLQMSVSKSAARTWSAASRAARPRESRQERGFQGLSCRRGHDQRPIRRRRYRVSPESQV